MIHIDYELETGIEQAIPILDEVAPVLGKFIILGIFLICLSTFLGPGGKIILNEESKLEQGPELKQKQEEEKYKIRLVKLKVARRQVNSTGTDGVNNTILYEAEDKTSSTIIAANLTSHPIMPMTSYVFGVPHTLRTGLKIQTENSQGNL